MKVMQDMKSSVGEESFLQPKDHETGPRQILPPADWVPAPEYNSTAHMAEKWEPTAPPTDWNQTAPPTTEWNPTAPPPANWNQQPQQWS